MRRDGIFQDDKLRVNISERDYALWVEVTDRVAKRTWPATPLLHLEIHDKRLRREERVTKYRIEEVEFEEKGAHTTVADTMFGIALGIWLRVVDGELSVRFCWGETYEADPALYRLFAVDLMPSLMRVSGGDARLMLPVNGATLCRPSGKPLASDRFMIYLEQQRWELASMLPIAAAWDDRSGLMVLATQAAAEAQCRVATDGKGGGQVGFAFVLRRTWIDPVEAAMREFRFVPIPPKSDPVHFVSKRLRRHVVEDFKKPTLKQRAEESPEVAYMLRSMTIKPWHGIQNRGECMVDTQGLPPTQFITMITFDETAACLKKLHDLGVPRLYTQSTGWNARGHDGLYPTRFPIEPRLGGEERFRELIRLATAMGYQPNVHDNYQSHFPASPDWNPEYIIHDPYGEPLVRGYWSGGVEYACWTPALPEALRGAHMRRVKALGVQGMGYCDNWFAPLEVNYHPRWRGTRTAHQHSIEAVLREVRQIHGAIGTEFGALPAAVVCDSTVTGVASGYIHRIRAHPHWPITGLLDDALPVWALALHGLTMHECLDGPTWSNAMACIAWGATPRDSWGVRPNKVGGCAVFTDRRATGLKALHDLCVEKYGHLRTEEITRAEMSGDMQQVKTKFADGTEVAADFAAKELTINGKHVERPAGFLDAYDEG